MRLAGKSPIEQAEDSCGEQNDETAKSRTRSLVEASDYAHDPPATPRPVAPRKPQKPRTPGARGETTRF